MCQQKDELEKVNISWYSGKERNHTSDKCRMYPRLRLWAENGTKLAYFIIYFAEVWPLRLYTNLILASRFLEIIPILFKII